MPCWGGVLALIDGISETVQELSRRLEALEDSKPVTLWTGRSSSATVTASDVSRFVVTLSTGRAVDVQPSGGSYPAGSSGGGPVYVRLSVSGDRYKFSAESYTGSVTLTKIEAYRG